MKILIILITTILLSSSVHAQDRRKVDSLNTELQKHEARKKSLGSNATPMIDTTKADILNWLSKAYNAVDYEKLLVYAKECLAVSEKIGYKKGIGDAYHNIGNYYYQEYPLEKAKEYHAKALKIRLEMNDWRGIGETYNSIALDYGDEGNSTEQLRNYLIAIKYAEKAGDKRIKAAILHNIGQVYDKMGNTQMAFENYTKAKTINRATGNKHFLHNNLMALGAQQFKQKNYTEALADFKEALSAGLEVNLQGYQTLGTYRSIGDVYMAIEDYSSASKNYDVMLALAIKMKSKEWIAIINISIGTVCEKQGNLKEALTTLLKVVDFLPDSSNRRKYNGLAYQELSVVYKKMKNYKMAWECYDKYEALKDKTDNVEVAKKEVSKLSQLLSQTAFDKQQDSMKAEQSKKDAVQSITRNSLVAGLILLVLLALILYNRFRLKKKANETITYEKERSDNLLLNILPAEVAEELKETGTAAAKHFDDVTVLFTDFKSFTTVSEQLSPQELVDELHTCFKGFDEICGKYNIEKIKTIGDAYLAVCGLPLANEKHAENVVRAAFEIREFMEKRHQSLGEKTFEIRIGINSGNVVAGIVGVKKFAYDIWGDTVNTAARMEQNSEAGKINISETTYSIVKDRFICEYRGEIDAKNKGKLKMYFVETNT